MKNKINRSNITQKWVDLGRSEKIERIRNEIKEVENE